EKRGEKSDSFSRGLNIFGEVCRSHFRWASTESGQDRFPLVNLFSKLNFENVPVGRFQRD
ncbi:MAG: hypothetical protein ACI4XB_01865, partial [Ruminococcus sp.]